MVARWRLAGVPGVLLFVWLLLCAADWPTYLHDGQRTGTSPETGIGTSNAAQLSKLWAFKTGGVVAASPTVVGGTVFVGSWDGYEYALNASTGTLKWKSYLGITHGSPSCQGPTTLGVSSAAAVQNGVVYVGGGDSNWYALNASTGAVLWSVFTGDNSAASGHYNWSSPLLAGGFAYIGVASLGDCPLVQGEVLKVDLSTHQVVGTTKLVPDGQIGGGVWTSPSIDSTGTTIYVTTGTQSYPGQLYGQAIVAIDASTMAITSDWVLPVAQAVNDSDWGTSPILFSDASGRPMVAAINKNGTLYSFDRTNLSAGPIWQEAVGYGGQCPQCGDASVSSGAFANGTLFFAGGNTTIAGGGTLGVVRAFDPTTGAMRWQHRSPFAVVPALAYANGLVMDGSGSVLEVLDAVTGSRLFSYKTPGNFYSAPSVANGRIFAGTTDGNVWAFNIPAQPAPPPSDPRCPSGWTCQDIGAPTPSGSEFVGGSTWFVRAGGAGVGGTADQFRLISQPASGDFQASVAVTRQSSAISTAQAGIMARQRGDANSPFYAVLYTPGGVQAAWRTAFGGGVSATPARYFGTLPLRVMVQRVGDLFSAAISTDGTNYALVPGSTVSLALPDLAMVGIASSSNLQGTAMTAGYQSPSIGAVTATLAPAPSAHPCPAGWNCADVGNPVTVGDQTLAGTGWTISGAGTDIGQATDQFHFVWQTETADATVSARVSSQQNTFALAKAGVMIRQSTTDASSVYYGAFVTPTQGLIVQDRSLEGLHTNSIATPPGAAPIYLRVARSGNTFCAYTSTDGNTWAYVVRSCVNLSMSGTVDAGLAVTSDKTTLAGTDGFDSLSVVASAPVPPTVCPSGWTCEDIGNPVMAGSQSFSQGRWDVVGGGQDIWNNFDQFRYVSQPVGTTATVSARLISQDFTDPWAKAGVMLRASADPAAPYYFAALTPQNGVAVQYRSTAGGFTSQATDTAGTPPLYLAVARNGNVFTTYTSSDGSTWYPMRGSSVGITMAATILGGMAVTSHNATQLSDGAFDTVSVSATLPPAPPCPTGWNCADIGNATPPGDQTLSNGSWSIDGGGADIWGTQDQFHYVWQTLAADGGISGHVTSLTGANGWAKGGLMLRASADPGAPYYGIFVTPVNGVVVQYRATAGASSGQAAALSGTAPLYLQIGRTGQTFSAYTSSDGFTWQPINGSRVALNVTGPLLAGLAVSAHDPTLTAGLNADAVLLTSTVPSTGSCPAPWSCGDVGSASPAGTQSQTGSTWTVEAGGPGISGSADGFHFIWQSVASDGTVQAEVQSQTSRNGAGEAGVMMRQSMDPGAIAYGAYLTAGNTIAVQYRASAGGVMAQTVSVSGATPAWLAVGRSGSTFSAYTSSDGVTWTPVAGSRVTLPVTGAMLSGVAVTSGESVTTNVVTLTGLAIGPAPSAAACPTGWSCTDIGSTTPPGSQSVTNGRWTVEGGGPDIWGTADGFHLVDQALTGDGSVSAQLVAQTATDSSAKSGLMMRQSTDPGSAFYSAAVTPGGQLLVTYRAASDGQAAIAYQQAAALPTYLELGRSGNSFTTYVSADGVTWQPVAGSSVLVPMTGPILAGMSVTSHSVVSSNAATYAAVQTGTNPPPAPPCPSGWSCADIGGPTPAGMQALNGSTWTIQGGGPDIWGTADQFHYVWQSVPADGAISAQVQGQSASDPWAKAGLMLRETTDPGSPFYAVAVTPGNGVIVSYRGAGGTSAALAAQLSGNAPIYLEIGRNGSTLTAYTSGDGANWTAVPGSSITFPTGPALVGMAVTSHSATVSAAATFSAVTLSTTPPPPAACPSGWTCADVGGATPSGSQSTFGGNISVEGGGPDIGGTADAFHFVWQSLSGDGLIEGRVNSQTSGDGLAKSGVMLRASSDPGAAFYGAFLTPAGSLLVLDRAAAGAAVTQVASLGDSAPLYLQIGRQGDAMSAYTSTDGITWIAVPGSSVSVPLGANILAGLAVTSHRAMLSNSAAFSGVSVALGAPGSAGCATGWTCMDVGSPSPLGGQSMPASGSWAVSGGGADIWGTADQFHFVSRSLAADGTISAHISGLSDTSPWAKGGVMLRQSSAADAAYYAIFVTPSNGLVVQYRATQGGSAAQSAASTGTTPTYVEVARSGNVFTAYTSSDGATWILVPGSSVTITMTGAVQEGIAVSSHAQGSLATLTVDSVKPT